MQARTILITGATSGIGRATALACAQAGANVVACGRRVDAGEALIKDIERSGGQATFIAADVTREEDVVAAVQGALECYGSLDFAFNNAGIFTAEPPLAQYDDELWHEHLAVGLTGVYRCMKHELGVMLGQSGDHFAIVNNASTVGFRGSAASGAGYTAVKHGIIGLTRQAAVEYADTPVRINAVCPGPTLTEATAPALARFGADVEARTAFLSGLNPTAELVDVDDIAQTVLFLCSRAGRMVNGHAIPLDGGQLAKL